MDFRNGWSIHFQQNVHMYSHRLVASKGTRHLELPCEDTPEGFLGIWLHDIALDSVTASELLPCLVEWAEHSGRRFRIYATREKFVTNALASQNGV